jgi:hypothetical protein
MRWDPHATATAPVRTPKVTDDLGDAVAHVDNSCEGASGERLAGRMPLPASGDG